MAVLGSIGFETQAADLAVTNSVVLVNSNLSFPIAAGQRASGCLWLPVSLNTAAPGLRFRLNVSSAPTLYLLSAQFSRTGTTLVDPWQITAIGDFTDQMTGSPAENFCTANFHILANAAAQVTLQFAQLAAVASTVTLRQGAYMQYIFH